MNEENLAKMSVLQSALQQNSIQLNTSENAKKSLEAKYKQLEEKMRDMEANLVSWMFNETRITY